MELLDKKGLTTVWAAIKNTFTSKSDADGKYANKSVAASESLITHYSNNVQLTLINTNGDEIDHTTIKAVTSEKAGIMLPSDKIKLDGIASGANNYTLPTASKTTLGGIKTSVEYDKDECFPICTNTNGVAYTKINGISQYEGTISSYEAKNGTDTVRYSYDGIVRETNGGLVHFNFPSGVGTLALTSDIPDTSNLCKANLTYDISRCKEGSINIFINNSSKDFSLDSIKDKYGMVVFAYVVENCNITANINMIIYNNVPNFTGKVSVTPGMFLIIPNVNNINIFSF